MEERFPQLLTQLKQLRKETLKIILLITFLWCWGFDSKKISNSVFMSEKF